MTVSPSEADHRIDYVLPLRWDTDDGLTELTSYLRWLQVHARVIVVDGSPPAVFDRHAAKWAGLVLHAAPEPDGALNGKVTGVHTGVRLATAEHVVVADDDVRYDAAALRRTVALLDEADLVGPQNVFEPMPWHAAWDTARSLLNRAVAADYPGTFAVRRSTFLAMGGYSGDVLFENLELMRTVAAHGGVVLRPRDIYVMRRPPTLDRFAGQRVRQAFDDLAQPWRLAVFLTLVPIAASGPRGRRAVSLMLLGSVAVAERGRRRDRGSEVFPARTVLFAPLWVTERAVCIWLALGQRFLLGGVRYAGQRLTVAAHGRRELRRRARGRPALVPAGGAEAHSAVGAVAERPARGAAAAAQCDGASPGVDHLAVLVDDDEVAADQERPVPVGRDDRARPVIVLDSLAPVHTPRLALGDR